MADSSYSYRGFMLDPARHFIPLEEVLKLIDAAAKLGMNRFHWHLTDDQGWRLEIKRYPLLTQVGSVRGKSCFWGESETENNCGFYTQDDVRRAVSFARERGVEIVPEIEVPGHASAMLAAYPQYGCRRQDGDTMIENPYPYEVQTIAGVFPSLICAGRDDAVGFLENILDEVTQLFPGPEVHIGGDEAVKMHWRRCPDCQRRMRELGLKDENQLQRWLVMRIGAFLHARGKKSIVWNESLSGGMLPHWFIVQHWWGNDRETRQFLSEGGQVLVSDVETYYLRPYQMAPINSIISAPAVPSYAAGHEDGLIGLECPLWGERITNPSRLEYMLFPKLALFAMKAQRDPRANDPETALPALREYRTALGELNWAPEDVWNPSEEQKAAALAQEENKRRLPGMPRVMEICDRIIELEALEKLTYQIDLPRSFARQVWDVSFSKLPDYCGGVIADPSNGAEEMNAQLCLALKERDSGAWRGKPENIWLDTMKSFTRFVNEHFKQYGYYGFDRGFWTTRQASAKLFRIGELEYELTEGADASSCVALHIPSDAALEPDRLNASISQAREFLKEYYPELQDCPFTLHSWLLSAQIEKLLPENSRIRRFRQAFDVTDTDDDCLEGVMGWVFDMPREKRTKEFVAEAPETTRLQKALKRFLLAGGTVTGSYGTLARAFE
ncbi:MAG: family 20 glycosylhydrolase [Clostridiales bacterium]|nr:family 20 glycosylhydrolase [Clostridiales bacterium]